MAIIVAVSGCADIDYDGVRRRHVIASTAASIGRSRDLLAGRKLDLDACVRIALAHNVDVKVAQLDERLATLDRRIAFGGFFPTVTADFTYRRLDRTQFRQIGSEFFQTSDPGVAETFIEGMLPVFKPEIWFLYAARRKGEDVAELTRRRVEQLLILKVTSLYYEVLRLRRRRVFLEESIRQAEALGEETAAYAEKGLATASERLNVEAVLATRRNEAHANLRAIRTAKAELLEAMGLSPLAEIALAEEVEPRTVEGDLTTLAMRALLNRPELRRADRRIGIRTDETRIAVARLLPEVYGVADLTETTDSFLRFQTIFALGAAGVLKVFDGFANLHEYAAAKERRRLEYLRREQLCLMVVLEVVRAHMAAADAAEQAQAAQVRERAAKAALDETVEKARRGLVRLSVRLAAQVEWERARSDRLTAEYRREVAVATVADVVGGTDQRR